MSHYSVTYIVEVDDKESPLEAAQVAHYLIANGEAVDVDVEDLDTGERFNVNLRTEETEAELNP